ncbi:MAG: YhbY family RNA-binding protein [Thermoplasmatota archaeon]
MDSSELAGLRARAQTLDPLLRVGKAGVTPAFIAELDGALAREALVKVKLLKSARESEGRDVIAASLAEKTGATLVEVRGYTAVFFRARLSGRRR